MSESTTVPIPVGEALSRHVRASFYKAGLDTTTTPPSQDQDLFDTLTNILPVTDGNLQRRWGSTLLEAAVAQARQIYEGYTTTSGGIHNIIFSASTGAGEGTGTANRVAYLTSTDTYITSADIFRPHADSTFSPRMAASRDWGYFIDGYAPDNYKWKINTATKTLMGITAPAAGFTATGTDASGQGLNITTGREYCIVFVDTATGHCSDLSPFVGVGPVTDGRVDIASLPVSATAGETVTHKVILATADGGGRDKLFVVTNATYTDGLIPLAAVTTFVDTLNDDNTNGTGLIHNNVFLETDDQGVERGCADNALPPSRTDAGAVTHILSHRGRLFMLKARTLHFSKSRDEHVTSTGAANTGAYEESWPARYVMDLSDDSAEVGTALFSDGFNLYVGTNRRVLILEGDGPETFQPLRAIHTDAGVGFHNSWQTVFAEGRPVGMVWVTPDYRVIFSDANTYKDIGWPIQATLGSINVAQDTKIFGGSYNDDSFAFYMLFIPTGASAECDTICVYNISTGVWTTWTTPSTLEPTAYKFIVSPLTGSRYPLMARITSGDVIYWDPTVNTDYNVAAFTWTWRTVWQDFGDPSARKLLNQFGCLTGNSAMTIAIDGASTAAHFATPNTVIGATALSTAPASNFADFFVPLAGKLSKDRYYRIQGTSTGTSQNILSYYHLEYLPFNRL